MFKSIKSKVCYVLFFLCAITSFVVMGGGMTSCEVGLGASVDTQPPTVDIQEPAADFIVREKFTMKGNCADEQGLQSVTVTLRNTQTAEYYPKTETPYEAKINKEQTEWECVVDPFAEGNKIPDGSYEATVIATDKAGRKTSATKSFKIDNTAPLLILTRPATKPNKDNKIDITSTDTYGQELSITGQVADDSNVDLIEINVYDEQNKLKAVVPLTNVPPTIDMSVATWKDENYNLIYGDSKDGTKYYYCEVIVHDEARKIPFDENDKGNTLTYYYFNDDIYSDLLSVYKATELYKILNGSYTRENIKPFKNLSDEQIATKVLEVKNILNEATKQTKKGTFSLNPENNPYFELDGYKEVGADSVEEKASLLKAENPLTNGNPLNVSILVGLDQAPIVEDTIGIKLNKILFKDGKYTIDEANPIWYIKPAADAKTKNELACRKLLTKVGANYKVSLKLTSSEVELEHEKTKETYVLPTLEVGNSYMVSVVGQDQNGIEFVQSYTHGIYFESNGNPPRLKITQPEGASVYLKKDSALELSGTVEADDFTTIKVYVEDKLIEGENSSWTSTVNNPSMNLDGTGTGVWSGIVIPASEFAQDESKEYFITVKAFAGTKESEKGLTVNYDVEGPIIEVNKIEPQVTFADANGNIRSDNVNGVFAVQVRIEDDFHRVDTTNKKPTINIYKGNKVVAEKLIYTATSETTSTTWNINTREGKFADLDKTEITIEIVAYDESGNESKLTKVVYLNQDSDKPVIELTNLVSGEVDGKDYSGSEYPNGGTKNIIMAESPITATITDDDKLSQVVVKIKPNGTEVEQEIITRTYLQEEITSNPWPLSYAAPKSVGNYVAEIEVTDETGITSDVAKFWFKINPGDPTIAINNGSYFGTTGKPINVQGSVSGFGGLVIYNKYDVDTSTGTKISGSQPDVLDTTFSFEDALVVTETTEGKASCKYAVTDANGITTTRDFDYIVDLSNPTVTTTLQIPLQGISSTDYKFTGITSDVENEFTSGVEAIFYQIIGANVAAPTVESAGWTEVSASSTWSFYQKFKEATASQETEGLPEGSYKLYVYAKDKAGNISEMNTTSFDVDLNKPTVQLYYNDVVASDNAVQKTNKDYKFSFVVNDTYKVADTPYSVVVTKDGATLANGTDYSVAQNAGKYNVTIKNYVDGNYVFKVTAIDWKAKETTSSLNITLDKTAPAIEVISPVADEWQTAAKLSIKGTSEDASGVASITAKDSQGNPVAVTGTTSWSVKDIQTVEGESTYTFVSTDTLGNVSAEKEYTLKVDHNDPVIFETRIAMSGEASNVIENNASLMVNKAFTLSGVVEDSYKLKNITLQKTDGVTTTEQNLQITKTIDTRDTRWGWSSNEITSLSDGAWTFTLTVEDASGKIASAKYKVTVDTVAPVISKPTLDFEMVASSGWFNKNSGTISGSVTDATSKVSNVLYLVTNERYYPDSDNNGSHTKLSTVAFDNALSLSENNFSKKHTFAEGLNYIYIKAIDNAGNVSYYGANGDVTCQIDTTVPKVEFVKPANGEMISKKSDFSFIVNLSDENSGFADGAKATVKLAETSYSQDITISENKISGTVGTSYLNQITSNTTKLSVTVKDKAGNETVSNLELAIDNEAPTVNIANPAAEIVNGKILVNGTASDNVGLQTVQVYRTKIGAETVDATFNSKGYKLLQSFEGVNGYNWKLEDVDTSVAPYSDGMTVEFYVVATDTAGNASSATKSITIDQDADRPIVKFSNVNLSGMTSAVYIWNKQETIYGTVSDDDGISSLKISTDNGTSWSDNLYKDGAWEYTFDSDGKATLMFKVEDAEGTTFTSTTGSALMANSPKLTDSQETPNTFGYKVAGSYPNNSDTKVYLTVDTQNPSFKTSYYSTSFDNSQELVYPPEGANWQTDSLINTALFGGPNSKLYLYVTSSDANGISEVSATIEGSATGVTVEKTIATEIADGVNKIPGKISVISIDTSNDSNWKKIEVTTKDESGRENKLNYSIQLDNAAPNVKFTSHVQGAQVYGSSLVTVRGNADDVEKLYLKITSSDVVPSVNDLSVWERFDEYTSGSAWAIEFDGENPSNVVGSSEFKAKSLNKYYDEMFTPSSSDKNAESKTMYVWIYGVDALGNTAQPVSLELMVNPSGDKPTIEFSYPENDSIVGGTIRVTGTSKVQDASAAVDSVWLQIDPSYNGTTFASDWETELEALITDGSGNYITDYQIVDAGGSVGRGIKVSGSPTSWNLPINSAKEFNNQDGSNRPIAIRAYAVSNSGKTSEPVIVQFEIDPKAPVIGSTTELELVQYANGASSGTIAKRQKYQTDMWISGQWYLVGSIEDDSGIKQVKLNGVDIINDSSKLIRDDNNLPTSQTNYSNYQMNIPVGETSGFGTKTYVIWAQEGSDENKDTGDIEIRLNYDNQVPSFTPELAASGNKVEQSNGTYTISGKFSEPSGVSGNQSGFGRIAMFFTRTVNEGGQDKTYVIDPMISQGNDGKQNRYASTDFTSANGMYWRTYTATDISGNVITLNQVPHANVRIGGLCKVDNVDYVITDVDGTQISIDGTPSQVSSSSVMFAVAQVIDNMTIEDGTTQAYDSSISDPIGRGDGDQMVEGISRSGTDYNWTVSINSSLIFDGSIDIHFVAFDAAGNAVASKYSGTVSNNQPRIAGVKFGTDENGNGSVEESELNSSWSGLYANTGGAIPAGYSSATQKVTTLSIPNNLSSSALKVKGTTVVKPEIVGGNAGLGYTYKVGSFDSTKLGVVDISDVHSDSDEIRTGLSDITITVEDFLKNEITDGEKTFTFNIWDKTEGLTYGTNSQKAEIKIKMNVAIRDSEVPKAGFKQFYWNSETDNSLYQNSRDNGHIELEGDLPKAVVTALGNDPKVSGKITFRGVATDNGVLKAINVYIPGLTSGFVTVATREDNGTWTPSGTLDGNGWAWEKVSETFTQETGHIVEFMLHWNTAKITNVAEKDVNVQVQAVDRGEASWNGSAVIYTSNDASTTGPTEAQKATYQMDVVPYIKGIDTTLTDLEKNNPSVYGRTSLGKYPVYYYRQTTTPGSQKSEKIILDGFNIPSGSEITFEGGATATLNNDMSFTLPENAKSGEIKVTVKNIEPLKNIESLNNINNNDAKGDYTGSSTYENHYNRQPNGQNNDLLTDNVELAIWEMNSRAAIAETGELSEVVMHVNPENGMVGLAFAHSQDLASYPNRNKANNSYNSYQTWITDWTGVNQIGFVYDKDGNMFGTNGGTDTYTPDKKTGRLGLISSHWGPITDTSTSHDNVSGYTKYRRLRLEYLGITRNGVYASNVNRFAKGDCTQLATTTSGNYTNLYMMYYDNTLGELKFKAGAYDNTWSYGSGRRDDVNLESTGFTKATFNFGDFADDAYNEHDNDAGTNYLPNYVTTSIVANQSGAKGNATVRPGIYYSVSAVPGVNTVRNGKVTTTDVVVAVWYDDVNKTLWYSYLENPLDYAGNRTAGGKRDSNGVSTEWTTPIPILDGHAGGYCAIKADDKGGIHIAAYSRKDAGSLYYAYLADHTSEPTVVPVDTYGSTGQYITMEVAYAGNEKYIPYIGYYMNSMSYPKYAYLVDTTSGIKAGVSDDNTYTGAWETILLPTESSIVLDDINIGIFKKDDGTLGIIPEQTENAGAKNGIAGGNGTSNPIFAYGIAQTGSGYIETAQLK